MAGPTFSITFVAGIGSSNCGFSANDALMASAQIDDTNITPGMQGQRMSRNEQINFQIGGVVRKATIDAERSNPAKGLIFLLPV
jgi:hypothetical protein